MQNIIATIPNIIRIETYVKGNHVDSNVTPTEFAFGTEKEPLAIASHDEIPCFFVHENGYFGAIKVSKEEALNDKILAKVGPALGQYGLSGAGLHVIFGPRLSFSHTPVEPEELVEVLGKYPNACKRTSGVNYLDIPLVCLMQFRALGVHMKNIHIGEIDTYENPSALYSASRGDEEENVTLATLL